MPHGAGITIGNALAPAVGKALAPKDHRAAIQKNAVLLSSSKHLQYPFLFTRPRSSIRGFHISFHTISKPDGEGADGAARDRIVGNVSIIPGLRFAGGKYAGRFAE
jgi:hypothetical protein